MPGQLAPYLEKSALERKAGGFLSGTNDTIAVKTESLPSFLPALPSAHSPDGGRPGEACAFVQCAEAGGEVSESGQRQGKLGNLPSVSPRL